MRLVRGEIAAAAHSQIFTFCPNYDLAVIIRLILLSYTQSLADSYLTWPLEERLFHPSTISLARNIMAEFRIERMNW